MGSDDLNFWIQFFEVLFCFFCDAFFATEEKYFLMLDGRFLADFQKKISAGYALWNWRFRFVKWEREKLEE